MTTVDVGFLHDLSPQSRVFLHETLSNYLKTDQLQDYQAYPKQLEFHTAGSKPGVRARMLRSGNQNGKGVLHGTPIPVPGGFTPIEDLKVGDEVFALDGSPTKVIGVYPQGEKRIFKVTVSDGATLTVDDEHLWMVRKSMGKAVPRKWKIKSTEELFNGSRHTRYDIPPRPSLDQPRPDLPVDPWLIGALIGDGGTSQDFVTITSADEEIIERCRRESAALGCRLTQNKDLITWRIAKHPDKRKNGALDALRSLGMTRKTSWEKRIPEIYLHADRASRLELLRGLMDTGGTVDAKKNGLGMRSFPTVSEGLAQDVVQLVRSLGMKASAKVKRGRYKGEMHLSWRVHIRCGGERIFWLKRKATQEEKAWRPTRNLLITDIEEAGFGECTCIKVAAEDGMFIAGEGHIPTHNTFSAGAEMAMHLTGEYPKWWKGHRFNRPIVGWAASQTAETTRDNVQRSLFGLPKFWGTGWIPKRCLTGIFGRAKGVSDLIDYYMIRHVSGGVSMFKQRYYAQDRRAWQGPPVDLVWLDEEPDQDIYAEAQARTIGVQGIIMLTFTPLLGYTDLVSMYMNDPDPENSGRHLTEMTIYDALHIPKEKIEAEIARWPKHEQRARIYGEPAMGVGRIYPYDEDDMKIESFDVPDHWPRIAAIDFGGSSEMGHPTAAIELALDTESDTVYLVREYREKALKPMEHWMRLRYWGKELRWAWPKDGIQEEKGTGAQIVKMYKNEGMRILPMHAQYPKHRPRRQGENSNIYNMSVVGSTISVERGILDLQTRIESGRFRVFPQCEMFFEEMRQYHFDEKRKVVKQKDDILDAVRYGLMMLRFASAPVPKRIRMNYEIDQMLGM